MLNLWRLSESFCRRHCNSRFSYPRRMVISGTPLNEAIISLYQILPKFKKENNVEKVQAIILTDGESESVSYASESENTYTIDSISHKKCINLIFFKILR